MDPSDPISTAVAGMMSAVMRGDMQTVVKIFSGIVQLFDRGLRGMHQTIAHLSQIINQLSMKHEAGRLTDEMLIGILVDNKIISEEEAKQRYQEQVVKSMQTIEEDARKELEEAANTIQKDLQEKINNENVIDIPSTDESDTEDTEDKLDENTNVELASERAGRVIKFPANKND